MEALENVYIKKPVVVLAYLIIEENAEALAKWVCDNGGDACISGKLAGCELLFHLYVSKTATQCVGMDTHYLVMSGTIFKKDKVKFDLVKEEDFLENYSRV